MMKSLRELISNRWQMPLALLGVALAVVAAYRVKPPPRAFSFEAAEADILAMCDAGAFIDASNSAGNLLRLSPPLPALQQARLHDLIAEVAYRSETKRLRPLKANLLLLLEHQGKAESLGQVIDAPRRLRTARAHDWLNHPDEATQAYRDTLVRGPDPDTARLARLALVRLLEGDNSQHEERQGYIDDLLADDGMPPAYLWRTLRSALAHALRGNDMDGALALMVRFGDRLKRSDLRGYHNYLWAWIYARQGDTERAAPLIDWVDQWLTENTRADMEMDTAGFLPALNRLLRADIELADDRPQIALSIYEETLRLQLQGDVYVWATAGRIQALAALDRHDAAVRVLVEARQKLAADPRELSEARPGLREALLAVFARQRDHNAHDKALRYLVYALELTESDERDTRRDLFERLALEHEAAAREGGDVAVFEEHQTDAAIAYEQAAELSPEINDRLSDLLWNSAACYDRAGQGAGAARMLTRFIETRSQDRRLAQALLKLAALCLADGDMPQALHWYERLATDFPELEEAARARLMKAEVLIEMGEEHYAEADAQLREILENDTITPKASVYRDALRALCELRYVSGRFADTIARIDEFLALYPDDDGQTTLRLTLAQAYHASADQLAVRAAEGDTSGKIADESQKRYRKAAEMYALFLTRLPPATGKNAELPAYERLAALAQGDCLSAARDAESAEEALTIFRHVTVRYQGEPIALCAQVRSANLLLRLGRVGEAARAVERARWLLRGMPPQAFDQFEFGISRAEWERFLNTVAGSELLRNELAAVETNP